MLTVHKSLKIYGDGNQTRSFQYIDDLVDGLIALMNGNTTLPVNLGNPEEHTIREFAYIIRELVGERLYSCSDLSFIFCPFHHWLNFWSSKHIEGFQIQVRQLTPFAITFICWHICLASLCLCVVSLTSWTAKVCTAFGAYYPKVLFFTLG